MTTSAQVSPTADQIAAWLRGLLTIAWADGHYDEEERQMIAEITQSRLDSTTENLDLKPISPADLAIALGQGTSLGENFLRTAVMVAIADGIYSEPEDVLLFQFCHALGQNDEVLQALRHTLEEEIDPNEPPTEFIPKADQAGEQKSASRPDPLKPVRDWLDHMEMHDPQVARFLCKLIPPQCPFERDVKLFGKKIVHIPPLCKLNPLYEQLVGLRFRALSYLADDCGEDVTPYC